MFRFLILFSLLTFTTSCVYQPDQQDRRRVPRKNSLYLNDYSQAQEEFRYQEEVNPRSAPQQASIQDHSNNQVGFFNNIFKSDPVKQNVIITDEVADGNIAKIKRENLKKERWAEEVDVPVREGNDIAIPRKKTQQQVEPKKSQNIISRSDNQIIIPAVGNVKPVDKVIKKKIISAPVVSKKSSKDLSYVQIGAFGNQNNAMDLATSLEKYGNVSISPIKRGASQLYIVRIGPLLSSSDAIKVRRQMKDKGFSSAFITTK